MGGAVQRRTWGMMRVVTRCACPGAGPWSGPCWRCGRLVTVETWTERHADGTATRHTDHGCTDSTRIVARGSTGAGVPIQGVALRWHCLHARRGGLWYGAGHA